MKLLKRIPGVGRIAQFKEDVSSMGFAVGNRTIKKLYGKAVNNFKVLAMGIESEYVAPKVLEACKKFCKDNQKDWPQEVCNRLETLFCNVEKGVFLVEDRKWILEQGVLHLDEMQNKDSTRLLKMLSLNEK